MPRTRIKICGITRPEDARAAVELGADALGLVFNEPSPRHVSLEQAWEIARVVPPFVTLVGLFVNETKLTVRRVMEAVPIQLLQFHGDEEESFCRSFHAPYIKAARVRPGLDLVKYAESYPTAQGLLLDAYVEGYGGGGKTFDWSLIPPSLPLPVILSGGLEAGNVAEAVHAVRPWAVDVSSGVEAAKGIKDAGKIAAFIAGVKHADV
ncbi:MAG: N-(5'-phosphoribosyl)anthranilate isomerase [Rhodocyclaceae bacterium]|uniref:N-(5'-phosphoribosyl)anthranilate isomerase n=1 Tax=Candidatus Desulfobacillus denitrificans TaxID=2608985 RepID=A0A809R7N3_9PROT|nr:phosphoribosylanthranilate isomerase [Rhodocyclaceae bacterium]BBO20355.1 N-(5'-phosphoribosyl)anthranilate isomerase [Candidatus Desulfobacillus denitrificans]GIK44573.1 MAG: N-(5'-phosphoribosyl)anthranilate isomerase [Betaproteobacteria bacterium]GJQ54816.1 MAG: N-(5'-phosphoribosyl)anthranilate isomerase [Rhodocyclaceae bacterium]